MLHVVVARQRQTSRQLMFQARGTALAVAADPEWLAELRRERERVAAAYGPFPDTTTLIAEDRRRDG